MLACCDKVVEECEDEVEYERSPDSDVVPHGPVGGVESDDGRDDYDQDGADLRAQEVEVCSHQGVVLVTHVRTCRSQMSRNRYVAYPVLTD